MERLVRKARELRDPPDGGARHFVRHFDARPTPPRGFPADVGSPATPRAVTSPAPATPNPTPPNAPTVVDDIFYPEAIPEAVEQGFADISGELIAGEPMSATCLPPVPDVAARRAPAMNPMWLERIASSRGDIEEQRRR